MIEALPVAFCRDGEDEAFYCVADPSGDPDHDLRKEIEAKLIPLTLGALAVGAIEKCDASALICNIYEPWVRADSLEIPHDVYETFLTVLQPAFLEDRMDQCVFQAGKGLLSSEALAQELAAIAAVRSAPLATWITSQGLYAGEDYQMDAGASIWYDLKDIDDPYDLALAKELGSAGFSWQYELVFEQDDFDSEDDSVRPKFLSGLRHRQLITIDEHNEHTPQVTILNAEHPVRHQEGYVWSKSFTEAKRAIAGVHLPGRNFITPTA
ncbi:MAG: hypothetical protein ACQR33_06975 [Candidatus Saccharibacteria bacterium]